MLKTRQVKKVTEEIEDIICNRCGESCKRAECGFEGLIEAEVNCGYGSCLGDGSTYHFSVCDKCLKSLFGDFKIRPEIAGLPMEAE